MTKSDNYIDELREILRDTVKHHNDGPTPYSFCNEHDDCDHVKQIENWHNKALKAELNQLLQQKQTYVVEVSSVQDLFADDLEVKREIAVPTTVIKTRLNQLEKE